MPPPPSMMQGGPGAEAMPTPMGGSNTPQQPGGSGTNGVSSETPTTEPPQGSKGNVTAAVIPRVAAFFRHGEGQVRERPSTYNPSGVPDEYTERTWEGPANTHPRQNMADRGVNTPQTVQAPIPQNSSMPGGPQREQGEGEGEEDEEE
jgi:hypothetical protein